jgi:hypothetical protein
LAGRLVDRRGAGDQPDLPERPRPRGIADLGQDPAAGRMSDPDPADTILIAARGCSGR